MRIRKPSKRELEMLRSIANYQFGYPVGEILITEDVLVGVSPSTRRIREVYRPGIGLLLVLRAKDYRYTLSLEAAKLLLEALPMPRLRAVVGGSIEYKSVPCRLVERIDTSLYAGDEVIVVDRSDSLIGVGRLRLSPVEIMENGCVGEAVRLRKKAVRETTGREQLNSPQGL